MSDPLSEPSPLPRSQVVTVTQEDWESRNHPQSLQFFRISNLVFLVITILGVFAILLEIQEMLTN